MEHQLAQLATGEKGVVSNQLQDLEIAVGELLVEVTDSGMATPPALR
jgi:hypothetical protein